VRQLFLQETPLSAHGMSRRQEWTLRRVDLEPAMSMNPALIWYNLRTSFAMGRKTNCWKCCALDWTVGIETWGDVLPGDKSPSISHYRVGNPDAEKRSETWESVFEPVRQPIGGRGTPNITRPCTSSGFGAGTPPEGGRVRGHAEVAPPITISPIN